MSRKGMLFWLFIFAVATFDIGFAIAHRDTMSLWEANPVMRQVLLYTGIVGPIVARVVTVCFAFVLSLLANKVLEARLTNIVAVIHLALLLVYASVII